MIAHVRPERRGDILRRRTFKPIKLVVVVQSPPAPQISNSDISGVSSNTLLAVVIAQQGVGPGCALIRANSYEQAGTSPVPRGLTTTTVMLQSHPLKAEPT